MAKQQRGSTRAQNRPSASASPSGKSPRPASSGAWQPNRVSAAKKRSGPNRTLAFTIAAVVVGLAIVGFVALQQLGSVPTGSALITPGGSNMTPASIPSEGRTLGQANAPVTIDLYGDFRCSACYAFTELGTAHQIDTQLVATGQAKLVWHDFTIIDLNDGATASRDAANAAWCGADQNKFWLMHDWLYANQSATEAASAFTIDRLLAIGQAAGMDMTTYAPCVRNGTHDAAIAAEQSSLPASVSSHGTPSLLVNGTYVDGTFSAVSAAVTAALSGSPASSASPAPASSASPAPS